MVDGPNYKRNFTALQTALDMPASDEALRHPYTYNAQGIICNGDADLALGVSFQDENSNWIDGRSADLATDPISYLHRSRRHQ